MSVAFENTKEDLIAFNLYHHAHSPTTRRQLQQPWIRTTAIWLLVFGLIWFFADQRRGTPLQTFLDLLPLLYGLIGYLLFVLVYYPFAYRRTIRKTVDSMADEGKNRGLLGPHRVTLTAESIIEATDFSESTTSWKAVERVANSGEHAFIYVNSLAAIMVPRRAFAGVAEFNEFVNAATVYREKSAIPPIL